MIYSSRKLFALLFSLSLSLSLLFSSSHSVLIQSPTVRYSLPINNNNNNAKSNNNHFHSESSSSSSSSINTNGEGIHLIHMSSSDHSFQSISATDYDKIKAEAEKNHEPLPFFTIENYSKNNNNEKNQSTNNNNAHHRLGKYSSNTNNNKHKFNTLAAPFPPTILTGCPTYTFWTSATIGSQTFKLLVDSGSSSLAVASSWCDSCRSDGVFPLYSPATKSDQKAMVRYGDGSGWSGNVYTDTVSISTLKKVPLKIAAIMDTQNNFFPKNGACGGATKAPLGGNYQGILGLAFNNLAVAGTQSYFETAVASNAMSAIYAVQFCGRTGKLWLGGYDELYLAGPISTATVISKTFWTISMNDLSIGGQSLKLQTSDYGDVVVDSGSAMLVLPTLAFNSFVQTMESNTFFTNNFGKDFFTSLNRQCKTPTTATLTTADLNSNLPKLTLTLVKSQQDGSVTTLSLNPVSSYIHEIILDSGATVYCPGVTSAQTLSPQTILGWSIMNQFVTIFDSTNSAVGFAPSRYCDTLPPGITATYNWTKEGASDCLPCGATTGTQSQKVYCQEVNSGLIVADNKCKGTKPSTTISCTPQSCGAATGTADVDDACQGIDCGNGKCVGGVCVCSGGFGGQNCDVPPGIIITNVTVPTKIGSKANVRWTFTGSFPDVSVFIFPNDPSRPFGQVPLSVFPTYIRRNAPNTGSFDWTVGMDLSGSIKVGVGYSNLVSFYSLQPLAIEDQCNAVDCGANGICNQGICQCKSGFTGSRCEINLCPVDQCNLRGTCNQGVCTCNDGFKGTRCEIDTRVCKKSCANGGVMDPTCTRCSCVGAWGEAGCSKCLLQCAANTQPDASCSQCVCTPGWGGIRCNVPFATVQLKLKDINVPSIIPPPNAQPELLPIAQLGLKTLKKSLQQDIAYALSIPADRVNISNTEPDTTTKNPNNPTAPNNLLLVTVQLLAVANAPASAVTGMVTMLQNQVTNITVFSDSPLGLGQMSYKVDLQFKIQYMRDQSADGSLLGDLQTTASRFWIFIIAGGGAILLGLGGVGYYRYRKRRRANMDKTVNQLSEVSLGTGNAAPVQRSGAKGYEMPTANAAFPKKNNTTNNNNNNTGTTQQFTTKGNYPVAGTVGGRNGEWTIFYTSAGDPYWYNNQNGISVWEAPSDF